PTTFKPDKPRRTRSKEPKPFTGYIHTPLCEAYEQGTDTRPKAPGSPPPVMSFTRGRRRTVNTSAHFCPAPDCSYRGWLGRGNIRANGHPAGQPWRQLQCVSCQGYFSETHGTQQFPLIAMQPLSRLSRSWFVRGWSRHFALMPLT